MRTVIIADDDRNVCECITRLIDWASIGYAPPILCHDGAEALEQFARRDPDLVITDLKMPVMDGDTLCREIRKRSAETEIVFLSAYEDFSVAQTALQYNVRDYILKPITRDAHAARQRTDFPRNHRPAAQCHRCPQPGRLGRCV